jgi:hypothetical protein
LQPTQRSEEAVAQQPIAACSRRKAANASVELAKRLIAVFLVCVLFFWFEVAYRERLGTSEKIDELTSSNTCKMPNKQADKYNLIGFGRVTRVMPTSVSIHARSRLQVAYIEMPSIFWLFACHRCIVAWNK